MEKEEKKIYEYEEPASNIEYYEDQVVVVESFQTEKWKEAELDVMITTLYLENGAEVRTGSKMILQICRRMKLAGKLPFRARMIRVHTDELVTHTFKPSGFGRDSE